MEGYDDDEMLDKFRSGGSGAGLKRFEGEATPKRARKDVRMRTGRTLGYELGKEGRKTGVTRKANVTKDADDLDNVEDFFDSDEEEEAPIARAKAFKAKPTRPSPRRIGERSPAQESTSDMSLVSTPASRSAFANPRSKKGTPSRQRRPSRSPALSRPLEEEEEDDVPAFEYDDTDMVDVAEYSAALDDSPPGGADFDDFDMAMDEDEDEDEDEGAGEEDEEDLQATPISSRSGSAKRMGASEYADLTVKELRDLCTAAGIRAGKSTKRELIKLLLGAKASGTPKAKRTPKAKSTPKQRVPRPSPVPSLYDSDFEEDESDEEATVDSLMLEDDDDDEIDLASFDVPNVTSWGSSRLRAELSSLGHSTSGSREQLAKKLQKALVEQALSTTPRRKQGEASPFSGQSKKKASRKRRRSSVDGPGADDYEEDMKGEASPDAYGKPKRLTRRPPLAFWKNEHVAYGRRRSGNFATVVDIVEQDEDDAFAPPKKKVKRSTSSKKRVIHPVSAVYNWVSREEMDYRVVKSEDMLKFNPLSKVSSKAYNSSVTTSSKSANVASSDVKVAYAFDEGDSFTSGVLKIGPGETTPTQNSAYSMEVFYVVAGSLEVTINKTTFSVKKGSHFFVPSENRFRMSNTSARSEASVVFFRTVRLEAD